MMACQGTSHGGGRSFGQTRSLLEDAIVMCLAGQVMEMECVYTIGQGQAMETETRETGQNNRKSLNRGLCCSLSDQHYFPFQLMNIGMISVITGISDHPCISPGRHELSFVMPVPGLTYIKCFVNNLSPSIVDGQLKKANIVPKNMMKAVHPRLLRNKSVRNK
jgi:hypothetical protein